eukprot:GFYU01041949.1.p1 GENE.GFYU01041949.1~~GFYU01041949.1.p1  ORF type:complete len:540 (-),score=189.64 GFYU01041949.1:33-1412(-)
MSVWDVKTKKSLTTMRTHSDQVFEVGVNPVTDKIVTVGVKHINFFNYADDTKTSLEKHRGIFGDKGSVQTILSLGFTPSGLTVTGAYGGEVYVWKENELDKVAKVHEGPVFAVYADEENIVSGGKDGKVIVMTHDLTVVKTYNVTDQQSVRSIDRRDGMFLIGTGNNEIIEINETSAENTCVMKSHHAGELWGLACHPSTNTFLTAGEDKTVRLWDANTRTPTETATLPEPSKCAAFNADASQIAVGLNNGGFVVLSGDLSQTLHSKKDRNEMISDIKFSSNGTHLAVASHDNFIDIYEVSTMKRVGTCKGHSSFVTHIDWSEDGKYLQSNCGAYEHLYWDADGNRYKYASKMRDTEFNSFTCVLGYPVIGVYQDGMDGTDVNAVDRSHNREIIASGDDFGNVSLYKYPAVHPKKTVHHKYTGHSSHVTNVRFNYDDSMVLSTGGNDSSIFQWRVEKSF